MNEKLYWVCMHKDKSSFCDISNVIHDWFKNRGYAQKRTNYDTFKDWEKLVGPEIAKNAQPLKMQNDVLIIKVRNSVWTQELQFLKPELLRKIRDSFPETKIRDMMFRVGGI